MTDIVAIARRHLEDAGRIDGELMYQEDQIIEGLLAEIELRPWRQGQLELCPDIAGRDISSISGQRNSQLLRINDTWGE